jgi:hypothetical protein
LQATRLPLQPAISDFGRVCERQPLGALKPKPVWEKGNLISMKTLSLMTAAFFLVFGAVVSNGAVVQRISDETGVPVATLQAERASTGLGWGELGNAHLLQDALAANGSNLTFNDLVAMHQAGEGWGKIARDNGLNFGRIVSDAHRSSQATLHAQNTQTVHGKSSSMHGRSATNIGRGHTTTMRGMGRGPTMKSGRGGFHGMGGMGHGHGSH